MKHLEELTPISREEILRLIRATHEQFNKIMLTAIEKHFGGDPMDHVTECSLWIQHGYQAFRGNPAVPEVHRLIRNRDEKILAEVKFHFVNHRCDLEWRIFE